MDLPNRPIRLKHLVRVLRDVSDPLILTHNDPDPDALAAAVGLQFLLRKTAKLHSRVRYGGIVGRPENKALLGILKPRPRPLPRRAKIDPGSVVLVDCQPGFGNNPIAAGERVAAVFDHHGASEEPWEARLPVLRSDLGATATIVTLWLMEERIQPTAALATGLFYGIKTDTLGLARGASQDDVNAFLFLQRRLDAEALAEIESAPVGREYFGFLHAAARNALIRGGIVTCDLGNVDRPDLPAEMADLLGRLDEAKWTIVVGEFRRCLYLAVRTRLRRGRAGRLAASVVGSRGMAGGHGSIAGGQIPLKRGSGEALAREILQGFVDALGPPAEPSVPLVVPKADLSA